MCRPLKDIVAEYDRKYQECRLCTLEERARYICDYEASMEQLFKVMDSYISDVKYTLDNELSLSVISRLTQNLIIYLVHAHDMSMPYSTAIFEYLMDERYDQNYIYWKEFDDRSCKIKPLLEKLHDNNIFCIKETTLDSYLQDIHVIDGFDDNVPSTVMQENELTIKNGAELIVCLYYLLELMEDELTSLKAPFFTLEDEVLRELYEMNYLLYAKEYWPVVERNFRPHIIKQYLKGNVKISELERLRLDKVRDFEYNTDSGKIWRDYSEDTLQLAKRLKEQIKTDSEWLSFFQSIFELDEYDRWIDELRNPPEAKIKAAKLTSNKQFMAIMAKAVEQGLCTQNDWQYKWANRGDGAYFASVASHKFELGKSHDRDGDLTISWKPFEALFGEKNLRSVFNDWQNSKYSHDNKKKIDKLLR